MLLSVGFYIHVTERLSRMSEDAILYEFTVEDPATYVGPWGCSPEA